MDAQQRYLLQLLRDEPIFSAYLFDTVSQNIAALVNTIKDVKFTTLGERLENWVSSKNKKTIYVTHEEIASHLGTSRPIISKLLKDLEKEKKIILKRGSIEVI